MITAIAALCTVGAILVHMAVTRPILRHLGWA